jgi:hypothetical protein
MTKTNSAAEGPLLYSVPEARKKLGNLSDTAIRDLVRRGKLDGRKLGARLMITATSVDRFAANLPRAVREGGR